MFKNKPKRPNKIEEPIPKPKPISLKADISKSLIKTLIHNFEKQLRDHVEDRDKKIEIKEKKLEELNRF